ncbi:MAG: transcription elongation factor GreA [Pseudobdellovibrionaceae bacterium]
MPTEKMPITVFGKAQLESELKKLMHEQRPAVIRAIEEARSHGDISENAEYDAAKEQQAMIEGRIAEIQSKIAIAEVVDPTTIKSDRIVFGAHFTVTDVDTDEEQSYQIVGVDEADVKSGKISVMSPLARAVIGKQVGDIVVVRSPKGDKEFEVKVFSFK